jgi:hypothetical protein
MKKPIALLKVAALSSSVLLFGGCVAYRGGAFQSFLGTKATSPVEPGDGTPHAEPELWSGTKSINNKGVVAGLMPAGSFGPPETEMPAVPANRPPMSP